MVVKLLQYTLEYVHLRCDFVCAASVIVVACLHGENEFFDVLAILSEIVPS